MAPTLGNGKICYIELPAADVERAAEFYRRVFGWKTRQRGDGALAFDDGVGEVSGTWTRRLRPAEPGLLVYIWVADVPATLQTVTAAGGEVTQAIGADSPEITARFRDPEGNVLGLYQEPK